jgi:cell fate regulator YaaT (PSP1 superfamily)
LVGIRLRPLDPVQYFSPGDEDLAVGDRVLVETEIGPREGLVAIAPAQVLYSEVRGPLVPVLGKVRTVSA